MQAAEKAKRHYARAILAASARAAKKPGANKLNVPPSGGTNVTETSGSIVSISLAAPLVSLSLMIISVTA